MNSDLLSVEFIELHDPGEGSVNISAYAFTMHSHSNEWALEYEMNIILGVMDLFTACENRYSFSPVFVPVPRLPITVMIII